MFGETRANYCGLVVLIIAAVLLVPTTMSVANQTAIENVTEDYYLVTFYELPAENLKLELTKAYGVDFLEYHQDNTYLIELPESQASQLAMNSLVTSMRPYGPGDKVSGELKAVTGVVKLRVNLHPGADVQAVMGLMGSMGIQVTMTNTVTVKFIECTVDASLIDEIASLKDVRWLQQQFGGEVLMDLISSNTYMGSDTPQLNGFSGSGILAEVQDDGIDLGHPDLAQVQYTDFSPVANAHGTCTSGIMFGNGAGDITALGNLNQATGVFCDWMNGNALSIQHLWDGVFTSGNAGMNGVVQTNSWWNGATMDGEYDAMSNELDQVIVTYPHVLTHWACGNSNSGTGLGLMSAESISKNDMSVGAIFHLNTASLADDNWHNAGGGSTPSRGPAADGRVKPDLIGPFDWIHTVDQRGGAGYSGTDYYDNFGGTSGATPNVAGCSGLAYEMYHENFFGNNAGGAWPYSCTVKALMIADAYQYQIGTNLIDRNVEGWGTPDMENMYNLGATYHMIDEYPQAMSSGSTWTRAVGTDGLHPLKITLCWIDPAAPSGTGSSRALINNLDLRVTSSNGTMYYGNNGLWDNLYSVSGTGVNHWSTSGGHRDDLNNVENVFIQTPQAGIWTIEVSGRTGDVAQGPQDFSLVSSGAMFPIPSEGSIVLDSELYPREATVGMEVVDRDLNTDPFTAQTVNVNLKSIAEPAGETTILTETGPNTCTFQGTKNISGTNSAGVVWVNAMDTITATYDDADDGTGNPAVVTDTAAVDGLAPAAPSGLTVQHWGMTSGNEVRFMRGIASEANVNGLTAYLAGTTQSTTAANAGNLGNNVNLYAGIRAWVRHSGGAETELTAGTAVALVYGNATGTYSALWTPPFTVLAPTDSVVVRFYVNTATPPTTVRATFTTEQLGATQLDANLWNMTYFLRKGTVAQGGSSLLWGTTAYNTRISGFSWKSTANYQDHNTLNWTHNGADVDHYVIYRSEVNSGPWDESHVIDSVPVGTNTYTDFNRGLGDSIIWWYVVRAEDDMGNREANMNSIPEPGAAPPYAINLAGKSANSWVFVSFPSDITGNIQDILNDAAAGDGATTWTVAKWFNKQTPSDPWKTYRVGSTVNDLATISSTMGVWLWITANGGDQALTLNAYVAPSATAVAINLYTGWNMVGYPTMTSRAESATLPVQADYVAVWQAATPYITQHAKGATPMSHGNAYWVHVTADCVWTVQP